MPIYILELKQFINFTFPVYKHIIYRSYTNIDGLANALVDHKRRQLTKPTLSWKNNLAALDWKFYAMFKKTYRC
jgi:hypothetical protein